MGWEVKGRFNRETYIYLWLIHVDVWQKPTQYCNYPPIRNNVLSSVVMITMTLFFSLKYSWFTMFLVYNKVIQLHIIWYKCSFSDSFPLQFITRHWIGFPVLYSRSLLSIYFIHSSVFLLNPNPCDIIFTLIFQMMTLSQRGGFCPGTLWIFGREAFIVPGCWAKS